MRLNNAQIMQEEVQGVVEDMKAEKAAKLDGCNYLIIFT